MKRPRKHLSFANVVSSLALFVALGGTSYAAIVIPRNSVGSSQIRAKAVGASEIRSRAVRSSELRSGAVTTSKLSRSARESLRGSAGPAGPPGPVGPPAISLRANFTSNGGLVQPTDGSVGFGNPERATTVATFSRPISACTATATLANNGNEPPAGRVTVSAQGRDVVVKRFNAAGDPEDIGFNLIVAC